MDSSFLHFDLFHELQHTIFPEITENISLNQPKMNVSQHIHDNYLSSNNQANNGPVFHSNKNNPSNQSQPLSMSASQYSSNAQPTPSNVTQTSSTKANQSLQQQKYPWRKGKWSDEEEAFTKNLIDAFNRGYLHIATGTTLRTFLSEKLYCDPMRITKKFAGSNCIGKQVFTPADMTSIQERDKFLVIQDELSALEKRFLCKLEFGYSNFWSYNKATIPHEPVVINNTKPVTNPATTVISSSASSSSIATKLVPRTAAYNNPMPYLSHNTFAYQPEVQPSYQPALNYNHANNQAMASSNNMNMNMNQHVADMKYLPLYDTNQYRTMNTSYMQGNNNMNDPTSIDHHQSSYVVNDMSYRPSSSSSNAADPSSSQNKTIIHQNELLFANTDFRTDHQLVHHRPTESSSSSTSSASMSYHPYELHQPSFLVDASSHQHKRKQEDDSNTSSYHATNTIPLSSTSVAVDDNAASSADTMTTSTTSSQPRSIKRRRSSDFSQQDIDASTLLLNLLQDSPDGDSIADNEEDDGQDVLSDEVGHNAKG